jgi:hypothetical protein
MDKSQAAQEFEIRTKASLNRAALVLLASLAILLFSGLVIASWHSYGPLEKLLGSVFLVILACIPVGEIWKEKLGRDTVGRVRAA